MKITKSELRRFIKEELVNQGKLSEGEARRYNFMVTHKESKATSQVNAENGNEAIMLARGGELKKHGGPEGDYKVEKITESRLRKMKFLNNLKPVDYSCFDNIKIFLKSNFDLYIISKI